MTKEKFEARDKSVMHCGDGVALLSEEEVEALISTPLERIKAMCVRAEVDSLDAWERAETGIAKAYHQGEAAAYAGVLNFIKMLGEK